MEQQPNNILKYCQQATCNSQIVYQKGKLFNTSGNDIQIPKALRCSQAIRTRSHTTVINNICGAVSNNSTQQNIPKNLVPLFRKYY